MPVDYNQGKTGYAPQTGNQFPSVDNIPPGDYDFTILSAQEKETKEKGYDLIELECRCEQTSQIAPKTYFMTGEDGFNQEQLNRFAGDCGTLGFPVGTWANDISAGVKAAIKALPGKRFQGTIKAKKNGKGNNFFINAPLADAPKTAGTPGLDPNADEIAF